MMYKRVASRDNTNLCEAGAKFFFLHGPLKPGGFGGLLSHYRDMLWSRVGMAQRGILSAHTCPSKQKWVGFFLTYRGITGLQITRDETHADGARVVCASGIRNAFVFKISGGIVYENDVPLEDPDSTVYVSRFLKLRTLSIQSAIELTSHFPSEDFKGVFSLASPKTPSHTRHMIPIMKKGDTYFFQEFYGESDPASRGVFLSGKPISCAAYIVETDPNTSLMRVSFSVKKAALRGFLGEFFLDIRGRFLQGPGADYDEITFYLDPSSKR